jgi:hypothetical protein
MLPAPGPAGHGVALQVSHVPTVFTAPPPRTTIDDITIPLGQEM